MGLLLDDATSPPAGAGAGDDRHPVRTDRPEEGGPELAGGGGRQGGGLPHRPRLHPSHQGQDTLDELTSASLFVLC